MTEESTLDQKIGFEVLDLNKSKQGWLDLSEDFLLDKRTLNHDLIHQYFLYQQERLVRKASTKTRAEVRGGGAKPWRQKGTGRARAGSIRSPLWRGGGVIFGPKPRVINKKMNRAQRRKALCSTISFVRDKITVIDTFPEINKVKEALTNLSTFEVPGKKTLIVLALESENIKNIFFKRAASNIEKLKIIDWRYLNPVDLLFFEQVLIEKDSLTKVQEWLINY